MKQFVRRHLGLIIFIIIAIVFPISMSNQVKLNMRIVVTGLAIDKVGDEYEITAQIVNPSPGNESPGQSAEIDFLTDRGETISKALSNLMYKSGKVSAFSHTSFVILGNDVLKEDATKCLDIFMRDKIIKNSALLLVAKDKAKDELKKTKNLELSVGLGLQKVFTFKQEESDGLMVTILEFLNKSKMYGKTSVSSQIELESSSISDGSNSSSDSSVSSNLGQNSGSSNSGSNSSSSDSSSTEEKSGSQNSSSESGQLSGSGSGQSDSLSNSGSTSGSGGSGQSESYCFKAGTIIKCFVDGKPVLDLDKEKDILGFMLSTNRTKTTDIEVKDVDYESLKGDKFSISINNKNVYQKIRFENGIPCLDMKVVVNSSNINDVLADEIKVDFTKQEFEMIKDKMEKTISEMISGTFEKTKEVGADVFFAYERAYKFNYTDLKNYNGFNEKDFIKKLRLNVEVCVRQLEY